MAADGEAVAEYSDAAAPDSGEAMVATALERWGRLDICVANAAIGVGGMFHRQLADQFDEVLDINLRGSIRLARATVSVMRPAGYGRIILVASTGGLHGDIGLSAGGGRLRRASVVEWSTVELPAGADLGPEQLEELLGRSHRGEPREFGVSIDAFTDLMSASGQPVSGRPA